MTEHLTLDARKFTEPKSGEVDPLNTPELNLRTEARVELGAQALNLLCSLNAAVSTEDLSAFDNPIRTGGKENMTNNQEGVQNAELFKRMYDAAIESIDSALQAGVGELGGKIPAMLSSIEALRGTPYVSSAPEFVAMLEAARGNIEAVDSFITLNNEDTDPIIAHALSLAKQQLAGTLIAYSPQR